MKDCIEQKWVIKIRALKNINNLIILKSLDSKTLFYLLQTHELWLARINQSWMKAITSHMHMIEIWEASDDAFVYFEAHAFRVHARVCLVWGVST